MRFFNYLLNTPDMHFAILSGHSGLNSPLPKQKTSFFRVDHANTHEKSRANIP